MNRSIEARLQKLESRAGAKERPVFRTCEPQVADQLAREHPGALIILRTMVDAPARAKTS